MKGKRFLTRIMACGLSFLMLLTAPAEMMFAQNTSQETEETVNETEEIVTGEDSGTLESVTATIVAEGTDQNISWSLDSDGALTISGSGDTEYNSRPWLNYADQIKTATVDVSGITDASDFFRDCENLTSVDLTKFDTSKVKNISFIFYKCLSLTQLDVSNFDTSNVIDISGMFYKCSNLTQIDVSNFDTSNVTDMGYLFSDCLNLTQLDVSNFDTSNATSMRDMFQNCENLTQLDISKFDTSNVTDMSGMFGGCTGLTQLDVSKFDTSNVTDMREMFEGCMGLTQLDVSKFDTSNVTDMGFMFSSCLNLTQLDVSNFDTGKVEGMTYMFQGCSGLTQLDVSDFDTSKVTDSASMFGSCSGLTQLDVSKFDTSNITDMTNMFWGCSGVTELDVSNFDTSNVTNMMYMFNSCKNLTQLDISNFDMSNVEDASDMLGFCSSLKELDTPKNVSVNVSLPTTFYDTNGKSYATLPQNQNSSIHLITTNDTNQTVTYNVIFSGNGSTSGSMKNQSITYGSGTKLTANAYSRKGYTFNGWNTKANGKGTAYADKADGSTLTKTNGSSVTLYAQWKKKNYTITYNLNSGTNSKDNPAKYNIETATITLQNPTRKGYTFKGWYIDSNYKNQIKQIKKGSTGNKTLYAKWSKKSYTITYNLNSGTNSKDNPAKYNIGTATIKLKNPTRKGYTFKGWYTDSNYKNQIKQIKKGSTGNKTLYAKWSANKYTITFDANNKKATGKTKAITCKYGKKYTLTSNGFKRKGYAFKGWNTKKDGSGKTYKNKAQIKNLTSKSNGKVVLYAQWKKKK